jgi:anthranilate phosphoribosyltransferase
VERSCKAFMEILAGARSPAADVVALNAAVVFHAIGVEEKLVPAFERARGLLRSGAVWPTFERAREFATHG